MADTKQEKQNLKHHKLDPSLYLADGENSTGKMSSISSTSSGFNSKTMLRRRSTANTQTRQQQQQQQMNNPNYQTIIPLNSATFIPREGLCKSNNQAEDQLEKKARPATPAIGNDSNMSHEKVLSDETRERIFSITTSLLLVLFTLSLISIFCLCTINGSTLLVSAHYSTKDQQRTNSSPRTMPQATPEPHLSSPEPPQPTVASNIGAHNQNQLSLDSNSNHMRRAQAQTNPISIDRFDEGEQIKPPLLRQPTTLAPLQRRSGQLDGHRQQSVAIDEEVNLQTAAATQDTSLSPEDRDQLMRSQESHYEGRNPDQQQQHQQQQQQGLPSSGDMSSASDGYEAPSRGWNGRGGDGGGGGGNAPRLSGFESNNNNNNVPVDQSAAAGDSDDGDYEDDPSEQPPGRMQAANLVPENRRLAAGASANYRQQQPYRQQQQQQYAQPMGDSPSNADEGDPSDDYNGGGGGDGTNDDAYFSRKLNPAASFNQQVPSGSMRSAQPKREFKRFGLERRLYRGDAQKQSIDNNADNGKGFGPGPNEAYLVDQAESNKMGAGVDSEDDGPAMYPAVGGGGASGSSGGMDDEDARFDRRSMNYANSNNVNANPQQPMQGDNNDPDMDSDSDEPSDPSEESASSYAPSQQVNQAQVNQANVNAKFAPNSLAPAGDQLINAATLPKTSASAPAPQSAPPYPKAAQMARQQETKTSIRARGVQTPASISRPAPVSESPGSLNRQQQPYRATQSPYDPLSNPSHAGKYIINRR